MMNLFAAMLQNQRDFAKRKHRFATPIEEQKDIARIWDKVQKDTGQYAHSKHPPEADDSAILLGNFDEVGVSRDDQSVIYAPGITDFLSDEDIEGVLAHELGHTVHPQDEPNAAFEMFADKWAAERGYGEKIISALRKMTAVMRASARGIPADDGVHPTDEARIAAIRAAEPKV